MELLLDESAGGPEPGAARRVRPGDEQGLAELMLAAYQGTPSMRKERAPKLP
jgi:hypothetical protein